MTSKRLFFASLAVAVLFSAGCGGTKEEKKPVAPATGDNAAETTANKLDLDSPTSPEGVTSRFFAAFFSGKDDEAWSFLTAKAQEATKDNFSAQASDTIRWKVTDRKVEDKIAYVCVDVSDLNEEGDLSKEELIFALRNVQGTWGVAGFQAGELAVNFEEKILESLADASAENAAADSAEPARVSQNPTGNAVH